MIRDLDQLERTRFDLLVIGGGIHGAAVAWDASLRGLSVALVEQNDFSSGTTGNSLRLVHGGLRALQTGDIMRLRQSAREQAILMKIAPEHLRPLPCLIPFQRGENPGAAAFQAAFSVVRLATADLRRISNLPVGRILSRAETVRQFGGFAGSVTGGALWHEVQVPDIDRLVLAFILGASSRGAAVANHVRVERLLGAGGRVQGVEATDGLTGRRLRIAATTIINASGPWVDHLPTRRLGNVPSPLPTRWARAVNLIVNQPTPEIAIGLRSPWGAERDPVTGGRRYLFLTPWLGASLAGTSYIPLTHRRPDLPVTIQAARLIDELNAACPALHWSVDDVIGSHSGKLPLRNGFQSGPAGRLIDRGAVVDHETTGHRGLISIVGAKFTTARRLAEHAVDLVVRQLGHRDRPCRTTETPLDADVPRPGDLTGRTRWSIEAEMALSLEDIGRRLGLTLARYPNRAEIVAVAEVARGCLGWSASRSEQEVGQLLGRFASPDAIRAA